MRRNLKKFVKARDEMLKKCDVGELRKFVNDNKQYYGEGYVNSFNNASDATLEITLHKMIVNVTSLPEELRSKSAQWLVTRGYGLNINLRGD